MATGRQLSNAATLHDKRGIRYWMGRAVNECERARAGFDADSVHDLRVALRRCRSMAEGFRAVDPDPTWRKMRKAGKALFSALGELRDVQVLKEWVQKLGFADDPVSSRLIAHCDGREAVLKQQAASALSAFDTQTWLVWAQLLDSRERHLSAGTDVFQVVALEKLEDARRLHRTALRNRSKVALHQLRIRIKRFRYIIENFLPQHDARWSKDLREVQDLLGEVHDLDVLWATALRLHAFASPEERERWGAAIGHARAERIRRYREMLVGRNSRFHEWRAGLPSGDKLRQAITRKFEIWAGFLDPHPTRAHSIAKTSLRIYDGLVSCGVMRPAAMGEVDLRDLLGIAALVHEVGRAEGKKKHHKRAARRLEKLDVPPGWTPEHMRTIGLAARYHRGALPFAHPAYARLARSQQRVVALLGGILRLAEAVENAGQNSDEKVLLERRDGYLVLHAGGKPSSSKGAERIAARRYLLETACGLPLLLAPASRDKQSATSKPKFLRRAPR
jgi:CHAD domain-containing protein